MSSAGQEGQQWLYVQAWDIIGNSSIPTYTGWFGYDTHAPTNPTRPANPNCTATDDVWQNTCNKPSFTWSGASDATSGVKGYGVYWGYKPNGESTHWESNPAYDALYPAQSGIPYYLRVRTKDNAGNWSDWKTLFTVKYDSTAPSNPTSVNPGCAAANNQWQNICNDANFTWSGASDGNGSGVKDYHLYWGESPSGSPSTYVTNPAYDPGLIPDGTSYYLRVGTRDNALNERIPATLFVLRYDATPPDISSFLINGGALTTTQVTVHLDLTATDSGSGVYQMRFSNNGLDWSPWEAYAPQSTWAIPALDRRTLTVYTEVRDRAGNMDSASDSIYLDLYPLPPHSDSYRICDDLLDAAGGQLTTTSYLLTSAVGQPILGHFASDSYTASAGFLARLDACLPITRPITTGITLTQWVIAAGGSLRGSTTYRLGDTAGEAAASEANAFSSASYRLTSGFWANITDTVPLPPPPPPIVTPPVPTVPPTPAPTPTPPPAGFGLLVNADDSFTNQPAVTLTLWGPGVAEMQISNDAGFDDAAWETYRISRTWTISTAGDNLDPRVVYARFRDWEGTVYGDYTDDIVYDPISPTGHVAIVARGTITVTLWLEAEDDNSSVEGVRLADDEAGLIAAPWQTFTNTVVYTPTGERIYAQFRDQALNLSTPTFASMVNRIYLPLIVRGYENSRTGEQTQ